MRDGQWRLYYSGDNDGRPGDDLTFGTGDTGYHLLAEPDITFGEGAYGDQPLPGEDGVRMGADFAAGMTINFQIGVDTVDAPVIGQRTAPYAGQGKQGIWNLDGVGRLRSLWRADAARSGHGEWAVLQSCRAGGRISQVIGRPRRFAPAPTRLYRQGYTPVVADFATVDDRFYEPTVRSLEVAQRYGRGAPSWTGVQSGIAFLPATGVMTIGGNAPAWPVITLAGPMSGPKVWIGDNASFQLDLAIAHGDWVQVDTRPWRREVRRSDGSSVGHLLTRASSRLAAMSLYPGVRRLAASWGGPLQTGGLVRCEWQNANSWL